MKNLYRSVFVLTAMLMTGAALAQGNERQTSGIDISGSWYNVGGNGGVGMPILAEYGGMPLNESARLYALAWSPARMTVRQQQCAAYDPSRKLNGGGNYRFWKERDPVTQRLIAIRIYGQITEAQRTIWMDGRPHPPAYAKHTWLGFSTGRYEGNVLTVYTTHLKRAWLRSNGVPQSDQTTLVEHFVRHGDRITYMTVLTDPVNLTEPYVRSTNQFRSVRQPEAWLYACDDGEQGTGYFIIAPSDIPFSIVAGVQPRLRLAHAAKLIRAPDVGFREIDRVRQYRHVRNAVSVPHKMFHQRRLITLRNTVGTEPGAFQMRCVNREYVAFVPARGKSQPGMFRVSGRVRAPVHPYRPLRLGNLSVNADSDQPLRHRISLIPEAVVAAAMQLAARIISRALLLPHGHPCRTPRQCVQTCRLIQRHSAILG